MSKQFNYIHSKLVNGEDDILGHIAYSVYKSHKIAHISDLKKTNNGNDPSDDALQSFVLNSNNDKTLEFYKIKANELLSAFINNVCDESIRAEMDNVKKNQHLILKDIVGGFWKQVWIGVVSSLLVAGLVYSIYVVLHFKFSV